MALLVSFHPGLFLHRLVGDPVSSCDDAEALAKWWHAGYNYTVKGAIRENGASATITLKDGTAVAKEQ